MDWMPQEELSESSSMWGWDRQAATLGPANHPLLVEREPYTLTLSTLHPAALLISL